MKKKVYLRDILLYASWFSKFDCGHIRRSSNKVADCSANHVKLGEERIWLKDPSDFIVELLSTNFSFNIILFQFQKNYYIFLQYFSKNSIIKRKAFKYYFIDAI